MSKKQGKTSRTKSKAKIEVTTIAIHGPGVDIDARFDTGDSSFADLLNKLNMSMSANRGVSLNPEEEARARGHGRKLLLQMWSVNAMSCCSVSCADHSRNPSSTR